MEETISKIRNDLPDRSRLIERNNLVLVLFGTLATVYFQDRALTLSFFAGGALTVLNLRLLRLVVKNLTNPKRPSTWKLIAQVLLKFFGGLGAIVMIMLVFHPHPVAFLFGLSTVVVAIVGEGIMGIFKID